MSRVKSISIFASLPVFTEFNFPKPQNRKRNIKIVPWTVNEISDLERMKNFDLDGIITDYPDRGIKVFRRTKP
jgi:glycerophosphoryl diester phosphodiesterase